MVPIEALFVASPPGFDGLHDDINFYCEMIIPEVIKEIVTTNSMGPHYNKNCVHTNN